MRYFSHNDHDSLNLALPNYLYTYANIECNLLQILEPSLKLYYKNINYFNLISRILLLYREDRKLNSLEGCCEKNSSEFQTLILQSVTKTADNDACLSYNLWFTVSPDYNAQKLLAVVGLGLTAQCLCFGCPHVAPTVPRGYLLLTNSIKVWGPRKPTLGPLLTAHHSHSHSQHTFQKDQEID